MAVAGYVHRILLHLLVTVEAQADEVVVLTQNLRRRTREVEPYLRDVGAQIVDAERHLFGQILLVLPDDPAQARIDQSVLVARRGDRPHPFEAEVPLHLRIEERQDETSRRRIDVDRNIVSRLLVVGVQLAVESLDVVVESRPRHAGDRHDANGVLVAHRQSVLRIERRLFEREGHRAHLDLPQLAELLPDHLEGGAHHQIGFVEGFALGLAFRAPAQPGRDAAQHTSLRRADSQRAGLPLGLFGRIPHVGDDVDAPSAHHRHTRILGLVDVVDVDRLVHQARSVFVHVGGDESRQIQTRLRLGIGLVLHHLVGDLRCGFVLRNVLRRSGSEHLFRSEDSRRSIGPCLLFRVHSGNVFKNYKVRKSINYATRRPFPKTGGTSSPKTPLFGCTLNTSPRQNRTCVCFCARLFVLWLAP